MRIIAGSARSLPLKTIPGTDTRPTQDKIKETLFNILQNNIPGSTFLDLFSGSGAIGLEAVSRGAARAVLVENSRKAAACIKENIEFTKFQSVCDLMVMDACAAVRALEHKYVFDIVYLDPPYGKGLEYEVLSVLGKSGIIHMDTILIIETDLKADPSACESDVFALYRQKKYKTNQHLFLRKRPNPHPDSQRIPENEKKGNLSGKL